ncbi:hypothetical protein ElyMa_003977700 [Elysia marginata]|uniref:Uncharacterized protein n=1 Tax=Elysia marginata TaxID=1093978 RepID=A0AAV4FXB0_9GAST|nr:hypothetical protein ElyMa_003977700 [Elysia marginata]
MSSLSRLSGSLNLERPVVQCITHRMWAGDVGHCWWAVTAHTLHAEPVLDMVASRGRSLEVQRWLRFGWLTRGLYAPPPPPYPLRSDSEAGRLGNSVQISWVTAGNAAL